MILLNIFLIFYEHQIKIYSHDKIYGVKFYRSIQYRRNEYKSYYFDFNS